MLGPKEDRDDADVDEDVDDDEDDVDVDGNGDRLTTRSAKDSELLELQESLKEAPTDKASLFSTPISHVDKKSISPAPAPGPTTERANDEEEVPGAYAIGGIAGENTAPAPAPAPTTTESTSMSVLGASATTRVATPVPETEENKICNRPNPTKTTNLKETTHPGVFNRGSPLLLSTTLQEALNTGLMIPIGLIFNNMSVIGS